MGNCIVRELYAYKLEQEINEVESNGYRLVCLSPSKEARDRYVGVFRPVNTCAKDAGNPDFKLSFNIDKR